MAKYPGKPRPRRCSIIVAAAILLGCGLLVGYIGKNGGGVTMEYMGGLAGVGSVVTAQGEPKQYAPVDFESSSRVHGVVKKAGPPRSLLGLNTKSLNKWMYARAHGKKPGHLSTCPVWYNDKYKIIFLKTPKTAGTTVESFFGMCRVPGAKDSCFNTTDGGNPAIVNAVIDKWADYFVFTFSRNVFRRAISQYQYLSSNKFMKDDCRPSWQTFCKDPYVLGDICRDKGDKCCSLTPGDQYIHVMPQYNSLLTQDNQLAVDYIGRVEHFEEDFLHLVQALNAREGVPRLPEYVPKPLNTIVSPCTDGGRRLLNYKADYNPCDKMRFFDGNNSMCASSIAAFFATDLMVLH